MVAAGRGGDWSRKREESVEQLRVVGELFDFVWHHKAWWMLPPLLALLMIAALVALSQVPVLGPLIYPLF